MYKRIALNGLAILALATAGTASAAEDMGFYIGLGIGSATVEIDDEDLDFDESDTAFKVFGGYSFNKYFAVELAYFDGGTPGISESGPGGTATLDIEPTGLNLSGVLSLPVSETFSLFAKLGYASYKADASIKVNGQTLAEGDLDDDNFSYGVGGAFNIGANFQIRGEYEAINVDDGDFNVLSVSGVYRF